MAASSLLYIGIKGCVIALDRSTGAEVWRTKLTGPDFVNVAVDGTKIFAATHGEIFCLNSTSGEVVWRNPLKGLGYGLASIGLDGGQSAIAAEQRSRDQLAAVAATAVVTT